MLEQWAVDDFRLRILSCSNNGPADTLNQAFRTARECLIGTLKADDFYPLEVLAHGCAKLERAQMADDLWRVRRI